MSVEKEKIIFVHTLVWFDIKHREKKTIFWEREERERERERERAERTLELFVSSRKSPVSETMVNIVII